MQVTENISKFLTDPLISTIFNEINAVDSVKPVVVDLTHKCNLRCKGCYFFAENMDQYKSSDDKDEFSDFVSLELARGTNYMTVVGGEPALKLKELKILHDNFHILPFTNGEIKIPKEGFENLNIAISLWGGHKTDTFLRGNGIKDVFSIGLKNYKNDSRVVWYYTTTPGNADEIKDVVEEIVANGNLIMFSFYENHEDAGDKFNHLNGFNDVANEIKKMIEKYPNHIINTKYLIDVATSNKLYDQTWGYDVCPAISADNPKNLNRISNGNTYSAHMKCFMPDLKTTRRCPVGENHDCNSCYNVFARLTWILINRKLHLKTEYEFRNWLITAYSFFIFTGFIDRYKGISLLEKYRLKYGMEDN